MEIARAGNHVITACPYCDVLLEHRIIDGAMDEAMHALREIWKRHLAFSTDCRERHDSRPSLEQSLGELREIYAQEEQKRQLRIDSHPDNGKAGYWRVDGVRHSATTKANSAREAIERCSGTVGSWESPEATFLGVELPEVF